MTAPRHLWSGDWRRDSAAAAQELAGRHAHKEEPAPSPPEVPPPGPSAAARLRAWMQQAVDRTRQRLRAVRPPQARVRRRTIVIALASLISAGAAFAIVSRLAGSGSGSSAAPAGAAAWLGVDTESLASAGGAFLSGSGGGAVVTNVVPGSPADAAGLEPGDLITQIDSRPIASPNDVDSAIAGMHAGQQVEIQYQRGPFDDAAQVTLEARPRGSP